MSVQSFARSKNRSQRSVLRCLGSLVMVGLFISTVRAPQTAPIRSIVESAADIRAQKERLDLRAGSEKLFENRWLVLDEDFGFLFCQVPKAANEMWLMYFRKLHGAKDWTDPTQTFVQHRKTNGLVYATSISRENLLKVSAPKLFKFAIVRHPLVRFFSAFQNKIKDSEADNWRNGFGVNKDVSVEEFIDVITSMDPNEVDVHFQPMHIVCAIDTISYDYIGKYEQLQSAWDTIQEQLHRHDTIPNLNLTASVNRPSHALSNFVDWAAAARGTLAWHKICAFYLTDFETFGYQPDVVDVAREMGRRAE